MSKVRREVVAVDVGSTRRSRSGSVSFAWAAARMDEPDELTGSSNIEVLVDHLCRVLQARGRIALGFEAPLFIPVPEAAEHLSRGREGEGNRSFAAPAGLAVATLSVHQAAWILRRISSELGCAVVPTFDVAGWFDPSGANLLLWEAFVSGPAHSNSHARDAATAVRDFIVRAAPNLESDVTSDASLSLIGAAVLWAGLARDLNLLHDSPIVLKPSAPFDGDIRAV